MHIAIRYERHINLMSNNKQNTRFNGMTNSNLSGSYTRDKIGQCPMILEQGEVRRWSAKSIPLNPF